MTRRRALVATVLASLAVSAVLTVAVVRAQDDAPARLERAIAAMERLEGLRFELIARVEASGRSAAGPLVTNARMVGEFQFPDRLHVVIESRGLRRDLIISGRRQWIDEGDGHHQTIAVPVGPLRDARAPLTFLRGGGAASFGGPGLARGVPTYRIHLELSAGDLAARLFDGDSVPPDARGVIEVEVGVFDGLIRRQTVEITTGADGFGTGFERVRTTYRVEYWAHGEPQEVREPE